MKEMSDMAASRPPEVELISVPDEESIRALKRHAAELRAMFDALSPLERAVAGKQIAAVRRLVEAVEAL